MPATARVAHPLNQPECSYRDRVSGDSDITAEQWFLHRGLPSAIPGRARWRGVLRRSAPALAAWAALMVMSTLVMAASGDQDIDVADDPTPLQWLTLVLFFLIPVVMVLAGWAVSRIRRAGVRTAVAIASIVVGATSDWYEDGAADVAVDLLVDGATVAVILIVTGTGIGAILGWSVRVVLSHLSSVGRLMARSLPVVLLTVLVFFNATVWTVAASLDGLRIGVLVMFMAAIAVTFLVTGLLDSVRPVITTPPELAPGSSDTDLSQTPFAELSDPDEPPRLGRGERANILLNVAVSQVVQVLMLAVVTGAVFFVLGLIVLNPAVLAKLTNGAPTQSVWFDITLPVATAHVHMTLFLTALTFMYVSARAVGDGEYRSAFLDPLLDDLKILVTARNRYRGNTVERGGR